MQFRVISPCTILCPFQKKTFLFPSVWPSREYTWALIWKIFLICFSPLFPQAGQKEDDEHFASHMQIYLSRIFTKAKKFFKIEEVEYLSHYVKFKMWPALLILCKFPTFLNVVFILYTIFPNLQRDWKPGFWMLL